MVWPLGNKLYLWHMVCVSCFNRNESQYHHPSIRKAVDWLKSKQHPDGGWGENNNSYYDRSKNINPVLRIKPLGHCWGLWRLDEVQSESVFAGIQYLMRTQESEGFWDDTGLLHLDFLEFFIYATMVIVNFSLCGHWRNIAN